MWRCSRRTETDKGGEKMITGKQIAETAREAFTCKGGYIMGQMGATWTAAKQANMEKAYKADPKKNAKYKSSVQYGSQWIGRRVWDCAGLCRWAAKEHGLAIHSGSNLIWDCDLAKKGALTAGMALPVGALVFTGETESDHPHVGVYTGDGIVTEATGAKKGVIESKLSDKKWRWWGLLKGVTYEFIPGTAETPKMEVPKGYAEVTGTRVALRSGPTTAASVLLRVDTGKRVKKETPPASEWEYVSFGGKSGWMMKKFLRED